MVVVRSERRSGYVPRIVRYRLHTIEIKRLSVEHVIRQSVVQQLNQKFRRSTANKARFDSILFHHLLQILDECQGDAARSRLERESIFHDSRSAQKLRHQLRDPQPIRRTRNLCRAGNNLRRIANRIHFHHKVHVVALNLPGHTRKRRQVIGNHNHAVGVSGIRQRKTQRAAGRLAMRAIRIAEKIGGRRRNHRDVDVYLSVLNRLVAAAMRTQHAHAAHLTLRAVIAQRTVHGAFDVMDHALFHQCNRTLLGGERRARKPDQILNADPGRCFQRHQRHFIAVAQMMMVRDHHPVAQPAPAQRRLQIRDALIAVLWIIFVGRNCRGRLPAAWLILS